MAQVNTTSPSEMAKWKNSGAAPQHGLGFTIGQGLRDSVVPAVQAGFRKVADVAGATARGFVGANARLGEEATMIPRYLLNVGQNVAAGYLGEKESAFTPRPLTRYLNTERPAEAAPNPLDTGVAQGPAFAPFVPGTGDSSGVQTLRTQPTPMAATPPPTATPGIDLGALGLGANQLGAIQQQLQPASKSAVTTQVPPEPTMPEARRGLFGRMSLNQGVKLAGALAHSIAPNEWGGRMGKELVGMADESIAEQKRSDDIAYARGINKFNTADTRAYGEAQAGLRREQSQDDYGMRLKDKRLDQANQNKWTLENRKPESPSDYQRKVATAKQMFDLGLINKEKYEATLLGASGSSAGITPSQSIAARMKIGELQRMGVTADNVNEINGMRELAGMDRLVPVVETPAKTGFLRNTPAVIKYVPEATQNSQIARFESEAKFTPELKAQWDQQTPERKQEIAAKYFSEAN